MDTLLMTPHILSREKEKQLMLLAVEYCLLATCTLCTFEVDTIIYSYHNYKNPSNKSIITDISHLLYNGKSNNRSTANMGIINHISYLLVPAINFDIQEQWWHRGQSRKSGKILMEQSVPLHLDKNNGLIHK